MLKHHGKDNVFSQHDKTINDVSRGEKASYYMPLRFYSGNLP
jgi:hypothetical protein